MSHLPGAGFVERRVARPRAIGGIGLLLTSALLAGCPAPPPDIRDAEFASQDSIIECFVTVRNPTALSAGEDVPDQQLSSRTEPFLDSDGTVLQPYYLARECAADVGDGRYGVESVQEAEEDWRRFVNHRVELLSSLDESPSIFNIFPGDWCEVPGTLTCRTTSEQIGTCESLITVSVPPLPVCEAPSAVGCIEGVPEDVDFGDVPVGETGREAMSLSNCADDTDLEIVLDGTVSPVLLLGDFDIPTEGNSCHPINGDGDVLSLEAGESCSFEIVFAPLTPGAHQAETIFTSDAREEPHDVQLRGSAIGGSLRFTVPDLSVPGDIPAELCVDERIQANCTATRQVDITNQGPGAVAIHGLEFVPPDQGFELIDPPDAGYLLAPGETLSVPFRWCGPQSAEPEADLVIDSDDPAQPTFSLRVVRSRTGCP